MFVYPVTPIGGLMVATLNLQRIAALASRGAMPGENWRPEAYMEALKDSGFVDIRIEDVQHSNRKFQAIYATSQK